MQPQALVLLRMFFLQVSVRCGVCYAWEWSTSISLSTCAGLKYWWLSTCVEFTLHNTKKWNNIRFTQIKLHPHEKESLRCMYNLHLRSDNNPHITQQSRHQVRYSVNVLVGIITDNQLIGTDIAHWTHFMEYHYTKGWNSDYRMVLVVYVII